MLEGEIMSEQDAATRTDRNRRRSPRRKGARSTKVTCHQGLFGMGPNLATGLLDVSESGARLRTKAELKVGGEVEVGLLGPGHLRPVKLPGRVIWCLPTAEGDFVVGVEFQRYLSYADLQRLS
jgi:hypothetical protein